MNQSPSIKNEAEHPDVRPSYTFDLNKFTPSLKLIKRLSVASKNSSPMLNQTLKKDSQISTLNLDERKSQTLTEPRESKLTNLNFFKNEKNFFLPKTTLKLKRNSQSELKNSLSMNKLTMSYSCLISDNFSMRGRAPDLRTENSKERMEKLEDSVRSTVNYKFQKINRLANEFQLSNETYFSPYHLALFNKLIAKDDYNPHKKVSFNGIFLRRITKFV